MKSNHVLKFDRTFSQIDEQKKDPHFYNGVSKFLDFLTRFFNFGIQVRSKLYVENERTLSERQ